MPALFLCEGGLFLGATRLLTIHQNKGKTVAQTITDRIDYAQWSKIFNLKTAASTLIFLQENGLDDIDKLNEKAQ